MGRGESKIKSKSRSMKERMEGGFMRPVGSHFVINFASQ
jgi:hypothetical protein